MTVSNARSLVRPIITLLLVAALIYGFVVGVVTPDAFVPVVAGVVAFWFGSRKPEA